MAQTITLKLRYSDFKTITRAKSIEPTNDDTIVTKISRDLLHVSYSRKLPLRLLGVKLSNFCNDQQLDLSLTPTDEKKQTILKTVDKIRDKFGKKIIHVGST